MLPPTTVAAAVSGSTPVYPSPLQNVSTPRQAVSDSEVAHHSQSLISLQVAELVIFQCPLVLFTIAAVVRARSIEISPHCDFATQYAGHYVPLSFCGVR